MPSLRLAPFSRHGWIWQRQYEPVGVTETNDEVDEQQLKAMSTSPKSISRNGQGFWQALQVINTALLIAVGCVLLLSLRQQECHHDTAAGSQASGRVVEKTFGSDYDFMTLNHTSDHLWENELRPNNAIIVMPGEENNPMPELGSISMFHSLHCLAALRRALQQSSEGKDIGVDWTHDRHWPHCLWYLRSAILCAADDTLERMAVVDGEKSHFISGARDIRQCRDSNALYEMQTERGLIARYGLTDFADIGPPPPGSI